jgi:hypothetical protein
MRRMIEDEEIVVAVGRMVVGTSYTATRLVVIVVGEEKLLTGDMIDS